MASGPPPATSFAALSDGLLQPLLAVSLTGVNIVSPRYGPTGALEDFALDYLNPAAQRMTGLPERPNGTLRSHFPHTPAAGIFDFYRRVFETQQPETFEVNYQADGLDNYFRLAAQRHDDCLVVSFTDTADQPRTAVETALRASQAAEQAARAEAEAQRQQLHEVLHQAPLAIALLDGPAYRITLANPTVCELWTRPPEQLLGVPLLEALPELQGQGVDALLDGVLRTGEPFFGTEVPFELLRHGRRETIYFNFVYQPQRSTRGDITGVLVVATDVTAIVTARLRVEAEERRTAELNEELAAANEEIRANNDELHRSQVDLLRLNQELEARVAARTRDADTARADAEEQRNRLLRLFRQAPAHINLFTGPDHVLTLVHPSTTALLQNRPLLGLTRRQALPELPEEQHAPFDEVYRTGEPRNVHERLSRLDLRNDGVLHDVYFDLTFQPLFDAAGQIEGVMSFAVNVTERVQARQRADALQAAALAAAQRQAQERATLYQVFEETPALIALLRGPEHRFAYVNAAYQRQFPRELAGRPVAEALPEAAEQGFVTMLDRVYHTGETYFGQELPLALVRPDGAPAEPAYYNLTYQAVRENGHPVGVSVFAYDVTEQVRARREREVQRQRLHDLFMQAPAAICILDGPDLVYELVNPGYQALFPGRELHGRPLLEALPEIAGHAVYQTFRQVYETGETHAEMGILIPLARPTDGVLEDRYFNYIQQARRNAHGQPDGVLVFAFEVTEQVQARQASEAGARRLRLLTDALPVLIAYIDREEKYRFNNQAYERWFGLDAAALLGRPVHEVVGAQAYPAVKEYIDRVLAGERVDFEARMPYRENFVKHIRTTYVPDTRAGRVEGFYSLVSDVTEQVEAREQVEGLNQQLQAINAALGESNEQLTRTNVDLDNFIYTASHDLKAPISNIEGLLYLMQEELPPEVAQDEDIGPTLTRMLDAVERFKRTIDHLTEVSKLQKENEPATTLVNLAAVVEDVRQDLRPLLEEAGAKLVVAVAATPPIHFAEKNLRSIVYNLLSNAVKYRSPDRLPHVDVRAHVRDGHTVLEVHDNGLGLDAQHLPRLFTMFQRFHDHVEGTGIGLYMVKRMVDNAGGRIEVHSQLGAGTTFFVFLPHAASPAGQPFPTCLPS